MSDILGVYGISNVYAICVHEIDQREEKVLASANGKNPEWCPWAERENEETEELEQGFMFGSIFVPFSQVMRAPV